MSKYVINNEFAKEDGIIMEINYKVQVNALSFACQQYSL